MAWNYTQYSYYNEPLPKQDNLHFSEHANIEMSQTDTQQSFFTPPSCDPTISSLGGPDSEVANSNQDSLGRWNMTPIDLTSNVECPLLSIAGTEDTLSDASKRIRPLAPKPKINPRFSPSMLNLETMSVTSDVEVALLSSAMISSTTSVGNKRMVKPGLSDSSGGKLQTIEEKISVASVDTTQRLPPPPPPSLRENAETVDKTDSHTSTTQGDLSRPISMAKRGFGAVRKPRYEKPHRKPLVKKKKKKQSEDQKTPVEVIYSAGEDAKAGKEPLVIPCAEKEEPCAVKPCFRSGRNPTGCAIQPGRWEPRASYDAWDPGRPHHPPWIPPEEHDKKAKEYKSNLNICREEMVADPKPCCVLNPKRGVNKGTMTTEIRPEVRRWLASYPHKTRCHREMADFMRLPPPGGVGSRDEENDRHFFIDFEGPKESLYEGGIFRVEIFFPEHYPNDAPLVRFMTKIYHPNVDKLGKIRLPLIEEKWHRGVLLRDVFDSLLRLLESPEALDPIAVDVARRWYWQEGGAQKTAQLWTRRFAHRHSPTQWLDCRCECCCEQMAAVAHFP